MSTISNDTRINSVRIPMPEYFSAEQVFDCGQCFRFDKNPDGNFCGVAKGRYIELCEGDGELIINGITDAELCETFRDFLGLDFDYASVAESFSFDETLKRAAEYSKGIRILHQDEWETLCSFIISQNNNIPRIKGIISNLCRTYGEPVFCDRYGNTHYSFPSAERIAEAGEKGMSLLRTGFRARYIADAANKVVHGDIDLSLPYSMTYDEGTKYLKGICGVGDKVASCVLLFAYKKYDAFPIDVWMKKILAEYYGGKVGREYFGEYAGIAQQYLFYYERCITNCKNP